MLESILRFLSRNSALSTPTVERPKEILEAAIKDLELVLYPGARKNGQALPDVFTTLKQINLVLAATVNTDRVVEMYQVVRTRGLLRPRSELFPDKIEGEIPALIQRGELSQAAKVEANKAVELLQKVLQRGAEIERLVLESRHQPPHRPNA